MKNVVVVAFGSALVLLAWASVQSRDLVTHPVLQVSEWTQDWEDLTITVQNPGKSPEQGSVVVYFYDDGNLTAWKTAVEVPAESERTYGLRLSNGGSIVGSPEPVVGDPNSVTDAPDPVMHDPEPIDGGDKNEDGSDQNESPPNS